MPGPAPEIHVFKRDVKPDVESWIRQANLPGVFERQWPAGLASLAAQLATGRLDPNWAADLAYANDWQSALVPAYAAWSGSNVPTILTIHNLARLVQKKGIDLALSHNR